MSNETKFEKRVFGLVGIYSKNSKFNADFTGNPRRLPDENGTIYATDKALKYAIRNYWVQQGKNIFVWRSYNPDGDIKTRDQRMNFMKEKLKEDIDDINNDIQVIEWLERNKNKKTEEFEVINMANFEERKAEEISNLVEKLKSINKKQDREKMFEKILKEYKALLTAKIFSNCIDTKLFGVTYTGEGPVSLTGPVQISYGVNKLKENILYVNDILSPYPTGSDSTHQGSIGKETKALEVLYLYDFSINPNNIVSHYEDIPEFANLFEITKNDISQLKEALKYAVTNLDTTSKKGSENAFLLWIELPEGVNNILPELKDLVTVKKENNGKISVDFSEIENLLKSKSDNITVELYYNSKFEVKGISSIKPEVM